MYDYQTERAELFTDEGQRMVLKVRDFVQGALKVAGAVTMGKAIMAAGSGSSWTMMAAVDRLVELGDIREIRQGQVPGQCRIFVSNREKS